MPSFFQSLYEEKTLVAVKKILPAYANGELAAVCSWPDEIKRRPEWSWTYALHFVNTPDNECNYEYSRVFLFLQIFIRVSV